MLCRFVVGSLLAVLLAVSAAPSSRAHAVPRDVAPGDRLLLIDAQDGRLDQLDLFEGVLLASGIFDEALQVQMRDAIAEYCEQLGEEVASLNDRERAVAIHEFLHARVLTGAYEADCTQITRAIRDGDYNCVSATVLFQVLCQAFDLHCTAVATPTHVFSRVWCDEQPIDVQTTCASWFQLSDEERRSYERQQLRADNVRELGELELIAKIYYNRGVRHLEAERFSDAEEEFRRSLQLDPLDGAAQENLVAALNNWALALSDRADYAAAAELLERGRALNPAYPPLLANDLHIHQKWAHALCRAGQYAEAAQLLEAGRERAPDALLYREGPLTVYRMWMRHLAESHDYAGAVRICDEAGRRLDRAVDVSQWTIELAGELAASGQASTAAGLLEAACRQHPTCGRLRAAQSRLTAAHP